MLQGNGEPMAAVGSTLQNHTGCLGALVIGTVKGGSSELANLLKARFGFVGPLQHPHPEYCCPQNTESEWSQLRTRSPASNRPTIRMRMLYDR
jgi:hypothetical protein